MAGARREGKGETAGRVVQGAPRWGVAQPPPQQQEGDEEDEEFDAELAAEIEELDRREAEARAMADREALARAVRDEIASEASEN